MDTLCQLTCVQMFGKIVTKKPRKTIVSYWRQQTQLKTQKRRPSYVPCLRGLITVEGGGGDGIGAVQTNWRRRKTIEIERYAMTARAARNSLDKQMVKNLSKALLPANTDLRQPSQSPPPAPPPSPPLWLGIPQLLPRFSLVICGNVRVACLPYLAANWLITAQAICVCSAKTFPSLFCCAWFFNFFR